jgi:purine-binding chemotaxis protein CheW
MESPNSRASARREMLSFLVNGQEYCAAIERVREIRGWTASTPIAQAPAFVCGVINLRGNVTPVIDLRRRLGFEPTEATSRNVIIVAEAHGQAVGVVVDEVCETFVLDAAQFQAPPMLTSDRGEQFVSAIAMLEGRMLAVLNLDAVLPAELAVPEPA